MKKNILKSEKKLEKKSENKSEKKSGNAAKDYTWLYIITLGLSLAFYFIMIVIFVCAVIFISQEQSQIAVLRIGQVFAAAGAILSGISNFVAMRTVYLNDMEITKEEAEKLKKWIENYQEK